MTSTVTFLTITFFDESEFFGLRKSFDIGRVESECRFEGREWRSGSAGVGSKLGELVLERIQTSAKSSGFNLFEVKLSSQEIILVFEVCHSCIR